MFDGTTTVVDVETLGENSYKLAIKAQELYIAYEVVRRHIDANGARHYSQMIEAKIDSNGYSFTFDTGDVFTAATYDDYPVASSISDTQGGGTGGGVLVVNLVYDEDTGKTAFDKTWKEVYDADSVSIIDKNESTKKAYIFKSMGNKFPSGKYVKVLNPVGIESTTEFIADSENGYPAAEL